MLRETSTPITSGVSRQNSVRRGVTIVIPAHNEEHGIEDEIGEVTKALAASDWEYEIIVVDDGSSDATGDLAEQHEVRVLRFETNRGYGAALKAGIALAKFDWVVIIDADGTYPGAEIPRMLERVPGNDMVVGARIGRNVEDPRIRRPAKWILRKLAGHLAGQEIPDLNSGMRVIRKSLVEQFAHILPSGFSFTTTITLALISSGYSVSYVPIDYYRRVGKSKINPFDAFRFAFQILRTMMLFQPMKIMGPIAAILLLCGIGNVLSDLHPLRVSVADLVLLMQGIVVWCIAMVADQNSRFHQPKR
jgi:glycosyltransferase involved in cell wall biosynthesis